MSHSTLLATPETLSAQLDAARPVADRLAALDHLVARIQVPLLTYLRQQITESDARLDIYQDIWHDVTAAIRAGNFHDRGCDPRAYVFAFARHRVKHYHTRDRTHLHQEVPLSDDLADQLAADDVLAQVETVTDFDRYYTLALQRVPPDDLPILALWRQADASLSEIAAQVGRSHRAIWDIVRRFARAFHAVCPQDPRDENPQEEIADGQLTKLSARS